MLVLRGLGGADQPSGSGFGEELESPSGDIPFLPVATVGEVVVEDRLERFGRVGDESVGADVESSIDVAADNFETAVTKGAVTDSE